MQIILVPSNASRRSRCLRSKSFWTIVLGFTVIVPIAIAVGAYRFGVSKAIYQPSPQQLRLAYVQTSLENSQHQLREAERGVEHQLDTIGQRLGQIQAHMARVNALGKRITQMASLESDEFDFDAVPAMGGPMSAPSSDQTAADLVAALDYLESNVLEKREELEILEALLMDRDLQSKQFPNGWPVQDGWISSRFGYRNDPFSGKRAFHAGVDIASKSGTPIKAVASGVVIASEIKPGYGVTVEINHGGGYVTRYAHALAAMVEAGDRVEKEDVIAVVGSTGRSTGAHLHFEVLRHGKAANPRKYLRASL